MEKTTPEAPIPVVDTPGDEPCAQIWSVYISEAEKYDKALVDSWRGNMNGMLIFAGLFSAILTAFIIESYKTLQPDMQLLTLMHISQQLANSTGTVPMPAPGPQQFTTSLVCNILWFISLGLSLASAMTATLVEQWARDFLQRTEMLPSPVKRARIFAFLYYGLQRFRMHAVVGVIPLLLHMSLLFFFAGLVAFLLPVNNTVAYVAAALLAIIFLLYGAMSVLPLIRFDCPYKTPLSNILWSIRRYSYLSILRHFRSYREKHQSALDSPHLHSMIDAMVETATVRSDSREERDQRALAWTMKSLADDDELEPFVTGIPNSIWGPQGRRRKYDNLIRGLLEDPQVLLGSRIEHLMLSCESGLLEPNVKSRRQISCLKAIWCLGMMAEKNSWPVQPLFFLQGSRFLPPPTPNTAQYLPSISALAEWNTLCSLHGHVETLSAALRDGEITLADGGLPDMAQYRRSLEEFLSQRRRCVWLYLIPITSGELDLDELSKRDVPLTLHASSNWVRQVSQVINGIPPACWNGVQYRVLLSFLQQSVELDSPPYEFELTCKTIQTALAPVDIRAVGHVAVTFADTMRKAVGVKNPSINHVDVILGILLPWFDTTRDIELDVLNHVTDSVIEYVNNRDLNEAICRVLQDCDLTRVWNQVIARLSTCRQDFKGAVSKAMWHLAALFPGLSSPDARLSSWPRFNGDTLSVIPVAPYSASVMALIKTHILNAYEEAEIRLHLQALDTQILANEHRSFSAALMTELRKIENDWTLMAAVCSLLHSFVTKGQTGRPVQLLESFPTYTVQTNPAYRDWRVRARAAVHDAIELIPRLDRRMEEARLVVATQFIQACCDDTGLPYRALDTFSDSLMPILWVSNPPHPDNQKNFAAALRSLAETPEIMQDHLRLLQSLVGSPLFNDGLPWLDDRQAILTIKSVLQTYLTAAFGDGGSAAQSRRLEDILNWLEMKERSFVPEFLLPHDQNNAGPSRTN
ncbi:hypothetical protein B0H17DRAFT_448595 [Mycena rosella]|uniref:DUF6535 domain-containing protein n=1 Tax=Mycena rosella TaxID=1033263 RepID=A0AAD7CD52_MYCRO|nr:hypothetical protein B0H17DRAFT_448595 [Mycena rosella]